MEWFANLVSTIFDGVWGLFSIRWPGFSFTFGQVFLAVMLSGAALNAFCRMAGVSPTGFWKSVGGNNRRIKISKERSGDTK